MIENNSCPIGLHVVKYQFDDNCLYNISMCSGSLPDRAYWYVHKRMFEDERPLECPSVLKDWYWTELGWHWNTPKQYATPQEAYDDVKDRI